MFRGERLAPRWAPSVCSHQTVPDIGRQQRDRGVPEPHPPERWHTVRFVKPVCCIPLHGCFAESGVSNKKVETQNYMHVLPPAPSNQCWGPQGKAHRRPNKNSLFHRKPIALTHAALPNIDCGGAGGDRTTRMRIHFFYRNTGTHEDPVHWLQSNDRIINVQLVP